MNARGVIGLVICIGMIFLMILWIVMTDRNVGERDSVDARITLLEKQMKKKLRPAIYINRASVYNSDGEVVIEEVKK